MNFFERQEQARKKTTLLVVVFAVAVLLITLAVNGAVFAVVFMGEVKAATHRQGVSFYLQDYIAGGWWLYVTAATLLTIILITAKRTYELRDGGAAIANMAGGRLVSHTTDDPDERRLMNVVEEMSIASGVIMPSIYIIDKETDINAFAAGWSPTEASLVFSAGAVKQLSRDELQGVVAHEFSHVFNGDMRMNIRLIGVLAGIIAISQLGSVLMRVRSSGSRRGGGGYIVLLGLLLFLIGYIGVFCARIIKAAISRQREYLADASAVQFTRNPRGIGGALMKIKKDSRPDYSEGRYDEELSHMQINSDRKDFLFGYLLATHPPLEDRIKAIDPGLLKESPKFTEGADRLAPPPEEKKPSWASPTTASQVSGLVGNPNPTHLQFAAAILAAVPDDIKSATRSALGAKAAVYALLLADDDKLAMTGVNLVRTREGEDMATTLWQYRKQVKTPGPAARLPLVDLCIAPLKDLKQKERDAFLGTVEELIRLDGKTTLFEYALHSIMKRSLDPAVREADRSNWTLVKSLDPLKVEAAALVAALAKAGAKGGDWQGPYGRASARLGLSGVPAPVEDMSIARLNIVLGKLERLAMPVKQTLIEACTDCVLHDGEILPAEAELLRAVSENLGCPMPPLVAPYLNTF